MRSITKTIKPNMLIDKRDKLTNEISRYWKIIATENVLKKGLTRNYDLKSLLIHIRATYDELVIVKLRIQCANMGIKLKDLSSDANITGLIEYIDLNQSTKVWAEHILETCEKERLDTKEQLKKAGYSIQDTAEQVDKIIQTSLEKRVQC